MYDLEVDSSVPLHFSTRPYHVPQESLSLTMVDRLNVIVRFLDSFGSGTERQKIGRARALAAGVKKQTVEQAKSQITGAAWRSCESFEVFFCLLVSSSVRIYARKIYLTRTP